MRAAVSFAPSERRYGTEVFPLTKQYRLFLVLAERTQCPLYPRKRTSFSTIAMSALCQKQTYAALSAVAISGLRTADCGEW